MFMAEKGHKSSHLRRLKQQMFDVFACVFRFSKIFFTFIVWAWISCFTSTVDPLIVFNTEALNEKYSNEVIIYIFSLPQPERASRHGYHSNGASGRKLQRWKGAAKTTLYIPPTEFHSFTQLHTDTVQFRKHARLFPLLIVRKVV